MAIAIVVEDGTGLSNSNAYVSVAQVKEFADLRGITLPDNDDDVARLIIRATDYIGSFECKFCGDRSNASQALAFPRTIGGMPSQLLPLTTHMASALNDGFDPWAVTSNTDLVTEETVGPITTKFADPTVFGSGTGLRLNAVDNYLSQLYALCDDGCCGGSWFTTVRV